MINILDNDPEYIIVKDVKGCKGGSTLFNLSYCEENGVPYIVLIILNVFFKKVESIVI